MPEPDGPVMAMNSFSRTVMETPSTSVTGTVAGRMRTDFGFEQRGHVAPRMMSTGLSLAALRAGR